MDFKNYTYAERLRIGHNLIVDGVIDSITPHEIKQMYESEDKIGTVYKPIPLSKRLLFNLPIMDYERLLIPEASFSKPDILLKYSHTEKVFYLEATKANRTIYLPYVHNYQDYLLFLHDIEADFLEDLTAYFNYYRREFNALITS